MKTQSAHGCAGPDSVAYCVVPFPSTNASPSEITGKAAPIVVSATSIRVKFREAEPPTIPSEGLDKQSTHGTTATLQVNDGLPAAPGAHMDTHTSTAIYPSPEVAKATPGHPRSTEPLPREELHTVASSLPYDTDSSTRQVPTSKLADTGAALMITSTTSAIHKQVMGTHSSSLPGVGDTKVWAVNSSERVDASTKSNLPLQQHMLASAPTTNSQVAASISSATTTAQSPQSIPANLNSPGILQVVNGTPTAVSWRKVIKYAMRRRQTSISIPLSQYSAMMVEDVPLMDSILATLSTWLVLAGFIVLPNTFTTLQGLEEKTGLVGKALRAARNLPLLGVGYGCCGIGAIGMCILWYRRRHNFVWLLGSLFVPGTFNGLTGVISTFAAIYGTQNGTYSVVSKITLGVTGGSMVICAFLAAIYSFLKLHPVKRNHEHEMNQVTPGGSRGT